MSQKSAATTDYRQLHVWQKAEDLVLEIYRVSNSFPSEEAHGLKNQIRRAAISIPSNIAEGQGRLQPGSFLNHLSIAHGSLKEVECQLSIATKLGYIKGACFNSLMGRCTEVGRMLGGLFKSIQRRR